MANDVAIKWLSENKYEGKATKAFEINGVTARKGETLSDFLKRTRQDVYNNMRMSKAGMTPGYNPDAQTLDAEFDTYLQLGAQVEVPAPDISAPQLQAPTDQQGN